mgnify:CR=1 FL=1
MIKRLWAWLIRTERSNRPPLLQGQERPRLEAPPPPPPLAKTPIAAPSYQEVPKPPRGLRLIKGDKTEGEAIDRDSGFDGGSGDVPSAQTEQAEAEVQEATGTDHPTVKLVFSDGSTSRLTASGPAGVRIRYLAENILPPEGS